MKTNCKAALQEEFESDEEQDCTFTPSELAIEIAELKKTVFAAIAKRERVPQPTFWFLFHARLKNIQNKKELRRAMDEILGSLSS